MCAQKHRPTVKCPSQLDCRKKTKLWISHLPKESLPHLVSHLESKLTRKLPSKNFSDLKHALDEDSRNMIYEGCNYEGEHMQVEFSLLRLLPETEGLMATCKELGVSILAYSPLAMGRLTGKYSVANPPPSNRSFGNVPMGDIVPLLEKMRALATETGKSVPQVALNWCICKGAIPIPGAKNAKQAEENAGALGWKLTPEDVRQLSALGRTGKTSFYWQHG